VNTPERPATIPAGLEYAARRHGERIAYIEGERRLTWRELRDRAREAAAGLVASGFEKGDRAAICAENSIDWIVAYHATAMAGGAAALVYFDLKPREIEEQVRRPDCRVLFASRPVVQKLGLPPAERTVLLGEGGGGMEGLPTLAALAAGADEASRRRLEARAVSPEDLAAVIYTSGTTGGAKGVMLTHRNFMANAHAVLATLDVGAGDSVLLVLPLHHALPFMATVLLPGLVGAHFIIENDLRRIRDRLQEHRPTIFFGVPALYELMYRNLLARAESEGRLQTLLAWQARSRAIKRLTGLNLGPLLFRRVHKALGGRLRFLVSGGAALKPQTALDFFSLGLPLLQGWGMTEASPAIAVQRFSRARFLLTRYYERHAGSVGQPLPGIEVRLADVPEKEIFVAQGGEGEVLVRGENVFAGYWLAEEETLQAKRDGWLRTGDLARIDAAGNIYLTGRSKYVIVLDSGEKVHPDEVEENLAESDLIEDVCVVGRGARGKTHVAAVVYGSVEAARLRAEQGGFSLDEASLRRLVEAEVDRLGRRLAAYKRVAQVELADGPLPKTPLQKVARGRIAERYDFDFEKWLASGS